MTVIFDDFSLNETLNTYMYKLTNSKKRSAIVHAYVYA